MQPSVDQLRSDGFLIQYLCIALASSFVRPEVAVVEAHDSVEQTGPLLQKRPRWLPALRAIMPGRGVTASLSNAPVYSLPDR
jgi:hypothetical protein